MKFHTQSECQKSDPMLNSILNETGVTLFKEDNLERDQDTTPQSTDE